MKNKYPINDDCKFNLKFEILFGTSGCSYFSSTVTFKKKKTTPQLFANFWYDAYCLLNKEAACLSVLIISVELLLTVCTASSHYLRPVFWWRETLLNTLFSTTDVMPMSVASLCIPHKEYIKYALNMANGKCTTRIICDIIFVFSFLLCFACEQKQVTHYNLI